MKYHGIVIADEHFGVMDPKKLYIEHIDVFIDYIINIKEINFLVIAGDYFDKKMYLNDDGANYAIKLMDILVTISRERQFPIRIVYGTRSHESDQYSVFDSYSNDTSLDFKVITTVFEEELLPNLNVLYLPEEFIFDKAEYYKNYFNIENKYDYVFGHGVIQEVMTDACRHVKNNEKDNMRRKVPIFNTNELSNICKGHVLFGHYHINTNIDDKIFYVGSFSRWCFGESEPKGFYYIKCDTDKSKYTASFIENELADTYHTLYYRYDDPMFESENNVLEEFNKVDRLIESGLYSNIRLMINIPESYPNPEFIINMAKEKYKFNSNIKFDITNGYADKKKRIREEKVSSTLDKYAIIFDKSISLEEKIQFFIKNVYNVDIPLENIKRSLYTDITSGKKTMVHEI